MNAKMYGLVVALLLLVGAVTSAKSETTIRCGYFVAGQHPIHELLRDELARQLDAIAPDSLKFVFVPQGYGEADWKRDSCKTLATHLTKLENQIDIVVTAGPWVVNDLLAAGFSKPIVAMRLLDPIASGLADKKGQPIIDNLTLHINPGKIEDDVSMLMRLVPMRKLGVLFFPSDSLEKQAVLKRIDSIGQQYGVEVVTAEGFNNYGTYAFFKAAKKLTKSVDAVYLGPLWGMDVIKIKRFLKQFVDARIPAFTYEGKFLVDRGAFATNAAYGIVSEARYTALKMLKIVQGETPTKLDVVFRTGTALAVNLETATKCGIELSNEVLIDADVKEALISPEVATYYPFPDAVSRALTANPGFLATFETLTQAAQEASQVSSAYYPQLNLTARAGYVDDNTVSNTNEPIDNNQYRASFTLQQQIFSLETLKSIAIARKQKDIQAINQLQARLDMELAVAMSYLEYLKANEILTIQHRYREVVERNLELAATQYYLEQKNTIGFVRWQDERYDAITRLVIAKTNRTVARSIFNILMNMPPEHLFLLDSTMASEEAFYTDIHFLQPVLRSQANTDLFASFLSNLSKQDNPQLHTYDVKLEQQHLYLSKNKGRFLPSLGVTASYNLADELADVPGVFTEKHRTWSVFGELKLPLFNGADRLHERKKLKAALSELEYRKDAASLELAKTIRQQLNKLVMLANILPRILKSRELAIQNLGLVTNEYEAGRVGIADMLEAYQHARKVEIRAVKKRLEFYLTMAQLVHTMGKESSGHRGTFRDQFRDALREFLRQQVSK